MNTIRVVAAVIREGDKIFATARGYGEFKGMWEFPGGKIEEGETPQQALVREIKEELEANIEVGELIDTIEYDYPTFHLSMDCFWAKVVEGELVLKEAGDSRWLTRDRLKCVQWLPADEGLIDIIKEELPCALNSIDEMFRWKLKQDDLVDGDIHVVLPKVEDMNKDLAKVLGWEITDVLYSFTLIYYLGLTIINKERLEELFVQEKTQSGNARLCRYSTKFLYKCSKDDAFKDFNERPEMISFIKAYFSIGNIIPIWPGGNEARGKMGIYDIPELFFNAYPEWTKELIRQNEKAFMDGVIKNDLFVVTRYNEQKGGYTIKGYKKAFTDLKTFRNCIEENTNAKQYEGFYFDYLRRRVQVIRNREEKIMLELKGDSNDYI